MPGPVSDAVPSLADKLRGLPDHYALSSRQVSEINLRADELDAACGEPFSAKKMLGAWARARRLWCDITGDDLV